MRFLGESLFSSGGFLVIILVLMMGALLISSFYRRKKEEKYRDDLSEKVVKGAKIKTYTGIYATVVSVRNTTDGKIVLIESGEGDKKSYQEIHINAIYGIDEKEDLVLDSEGNEVPMSELNKPADTLEEVAEPAEEDVEEKKTQKTTKKTKKQNKNTP